MISLIKKMYNIYLLFKVKKLYAGEKYNKALKYIDKIDFKNKAYFYTMRGILHLNLKNLDKSENDFNSAIKFLEEETYFNINEKYYLKTYIYGVLAYIFKSLKEKNKSINMIILRNENNVFDINKIRNSFLYDFPLG